MADDAVLEPEARWDQVHARAMRRWKLVTEAEDAQRRQELEDLQFARGRVTDQWDAEVYEDRTGESAGLDGRTTPQRPTLVVDKLDQPVSSIVNEARRSKLALLIKPKGDGATQETADVLQGLIRAIEVDSHAQAKRMAAYDRAVKCGRGYYALDVVYANDGDLDLDIRYRSFPNQGAIYLDPYAVEPDRSDMKWAFIVGDYDLDEYQERFGTLPNADQIVRDMRRSSEVLQSINDQAPGWMPQGSVRVAEYYEVEFATCALVQRGTDKILVNRPDGFRLPAGCVDAPPGFDINPITDRVRTDVPLRRVVRYLLNAVTVLSEDPWNGRYIPIIPVYGKIDHVNGETSYQGVVTKGKDPQRLYNAIVSGAVEASQSMTKSPYIAAFGQIEQHRDVWEQSNVRNVAVLPYDPIDINGTPLPPPQRTNQEPALMGHSMLLRQADADIKATTGRWEASLGQLNPSDRSGKAITKLQQQAELGSANFLDNFTSISMFYEGTVLLDLIPAVYDRPGRVVRVLGEGDGDDQDRTVVINQPFVETPQGPKPVPGGQPSPPMPMPMPGMGGPPPMAPPPMGPGGPPPGAPAGPPGLMSRMMDGARSMLGVNKPKDIRKYDLSRGNFSVVPSVGPSSQTQREDNLALLTSMIENVPQVAPQILDLMAENMEGPMGRKVANRLRAMNPNLPKGDKSDLPPEAQAMIAGLETKLREMQQALEQAQKAVAIDKGKQDANLQIAQIESQARLMEIRLKTQADIAKVRAQIASDEELVRFDAAMEKALQDDQQQHELLLARLRADAQTQHAAQAHDFAASRAEQQENIDARNAARKAAILPAPMPPDRIR